MLPRAHRNMKVVVKKLPGKGCIVDVSNRQSSLLILFLVFQIYQNVSQSEFHFISVFSSVTFTSHAMPLFLFSKLLFFFSIRSIHFMFICNCYHIIFLYNQIMPSDTVLQLKHKVSNLMGIEVSQQKLLYNGKALAGKTC